MNDDLISRRELLKCLCINSKGERIPEVDCDNFPMSLTIKEFKDIVRKQPTAYELDKVISYLEAHRDAWADGHVWDKKLAEEKVKTFNFAIDVVKNGRISK
jgi:hypothetical protein